MRLPKSKHILPPISKRIRQHIRCNLVVDIKGVGQQDCLAAHLISCHMELHSCAGHYEWAEEGISFFAKAVTVAWV